MNKYSATMTFVLGFLLSFVGALSFGHFVFADTSSTQATVNATVSTGGAVCGNGVTEGAEECDDGNSSNTDACTNSCLNATCGDGFVWSGTEQCDDGASNGACSAFCSSSCTVNECGSPPPGNNAPIVSSFDIFESVPTTTMQWIATDSDGTVESCTIVYGETVAYGSSGTVTNDGTSYRATLETLLFETRYYYLLTCTDDDGSFDRETGFFITPDEETVGDVVAPRIEEMTTSTGATTALIKWIATDETALDTCSLSYTVDELDPYGESAVVSVDESTFTVELSSLTPSTAYPCRVSCVDTSGNSATASCDLTTTADEVPPPDVSGLASTAGESTIAIEWNDYAGTISDFDRFDIYEGAVACPINPEDGTRVSTITTIGAVGIGRPIVLGEKEPDTTYFYTVFVYDTSDNRSAGVCTSATTAEAPSEEAVCGNGIVEEGEACDDGNDIQSDACTNTCTVAVCGDGIVQTGVEQCDSPDFGGQSCTTLGYAGGPLGCSLSCTFDETSCIAKAPETCGDGILDAGETCDDGNTNNNDSCTNICTAAVCGDGVIQAGVEECDTPAFGGASCTTLGYDGGSLGCSSACTYDIGACTSHTAGGGAEICTNGIDDDSDGFVDCADSNCALDEACRTPGGEETERICNDGIDNDGDTFTDCRDLDCAAQPACTVSGFACEDGIDNDDDGLVDLADPGCTSPTDADEYNAQESSVEEGERYPATAVRYWIAERTLAVELRDNRITSLVGDQLTVGLPAHNLRTDVSSTIRLVLDGTTYRFRLQGDDNTFYADVLFPSMGVYDAAIEIAYGDGEFDVLSFEVESMPYGVVRTVSGETIPDTEVALYQKKETTLWPATFFRQRNPQIVRAASTYGFVVPNGTYRLVAQKDGYRDRETFRFVVTNNVVNQTIELIPVPETPVETISFVARIIEEQVADTVDKVEELADDPFVEEVAERVVVPAVLSTSVAVVIPSITSIFLPLLRFLFLQPFLLVGRRKRTAWGTVYNSLTKMPIDLAIVRLIDATTGKIVQSRATDAQGRYVFLVPPGKYTIQVVKQGYVFPSALLAGMHNDGRLVDLYHGEEITVDAAESSLTPNIPLDPANTTVKTVRRIVWERIGRVLQHGVSVAGIIITAISLYISPTWFVGGFLLVHILLYVLFIRYVAPKKPKGWGIVYDSTSKDPLNKVVARLFTKQYDKLVATELTDNKGRYSFLVGPNEYYVTFEKMGYSKGRSDAIALTDEKDIVVKEDIGLTKADTPIDGDKEKGTNAP